MRRRDPISELRRAIDCLPIQTRRAMLAGVRANPVVVGAYTDSHGGVCPMLAAHRNGGRTTFLAFARAWDGFAGVTKGGRARRATQRELTVLVAQLEASLDAEQPTDLARAIAEHRASRARHEHEAEAQAERTPPAEIGARRLTQPGSLHSLRPSRRAAEAALARVEELAAASDRPR